MTSRVVRPVYLIALLAGLAFVLVTIAFSAGWTDPIDREVLQALRGDSAVIDAEETPKLLLGIMRDITSLAGIGLVALIALLLMVYWVLVRKWRAMLLAVLLIGGTQLSVTIMKLFISRPRPDLVEHGASVATHSYPSGHSSIAAAIALTLAYSAARMQPRPGVRVYCWIVGITTMLLIGFSRMYLGVHWFSDVVAGLLVGTFWACLCIGIRQALATRGRRIDRAVGSPPSRPPATDRKPESPPAPAPGSSVPA
jgi:undecaprenyl-diphosphatase